MAAQDLTRARYAGYDFQTIVDDLRARIQTIYGSHYNDYALASLGMMLLDNTSFGLEALSFYLDRRATESYLQTARTRAGVARLARQLGYKVGGAVPSSTDLTVGITTPKPFVVSLLPGFKLKGPSSSTFEVAKAVDWSPAEQASGLAKLVPVYQGSTITETFKSTGEANQVFELHRLPEGQYVGNGSVEVYVDGLLWEEQDFLYYAKTNQFEVEYTSDPCVLRFGDGVAGNIPTTGATISVTYVATLGEAGNAAKETIKEVVAPLVIVGDVVSLSVLNLQKSGGGDNPESTSRVKSLAGYVFASRRKAVTGTDYEALAKAFSSPVFGRVAVAKAISSRSASEDLVLNSELLKIRSALYSATTLLRSEIATATGAGGHLPQLDTLLLDLDTVLDNCVTSMSSLSASIAALVSGIRANRNLTLDIDAQADAAIAEAVSGQAAVDASSASAGEKTAINLYFSHISSYQSSIKASTTAIRAASDTQIAVAGTAADEVDKVGVSRSAIQFGGAPAYLTSLSADYDSAVVIVGAYDEITPSSSTGLYRSYAYVLETEVADEIDPLVPNNSATSVFAATQAVYNHLDTVLSQDCKANLISVPILVRDAAGFYTEPSLGLIDALDAYLNERKEPTQNPVVVSGGSFLVYPWISVRAGFKRGYSLEQGRTAILAAIDNVLRERDFGVSLYVSDISDPIKDLEGVAFVNVEYLGYTTVAQSTLQTDKLDPEGNLIILTSEVITKTPDSIVVQVEAFAPPS